MQFVTGRNHGTKSFIYWNSTVTEKAWIKDSQDMRRFGFLHQASSHCEYGYMRLVLGSDSPVWTQ